MTVDISSSPVGVFDSGVGGLTVVREIIRQIPSERVVYFGDTARLPYGSKSKETVLKYSRQIIRFLNTQNVKAIVIACNTASAYVLDEVSHESDIPIIGVINAGAHEAAIKTKSGKIGVIGTTATVSSGIYVDVIKTYRPTAEVYQKDCPLLVPLVEEGLRHDSITSEIAERYLYDLKSRYIDTLVLGCTHYPLLRSTIRGVMGEDVCLINPAYETAIELKHLLESKGLLNTDSTPNQEKYKFYVSDLAEKFQSFAQSILPEHIGQTQKINIEDY